MNTEDLSLVAAGVPAIGEEWFSEDKVGTRHSFRVRVGTKDDAPVFARWANEDREYEGILESMVKHLEGENTQMYVLERIEPRCPEGGFSIDGRYLASMYIRTRPSGLGRRALAVVLRQYFESGKGSLIRVEPPIRDAGKKMLEKLRFQSDNNHGIAFFLARENWLELQEAHAALFKMTDAR